MWKTLFVICVLLGVAFAFAQTPNAGADWLHSSDAVITKAIDDGFAKKKLPKDKLYHQIRNWLKPGLDAQMEVLPPLFCALQSGQDAYANLLPKPTVESAKQSCDGHITVIFVHYSQSLNANWRCVLQRGEQVLQPTARRLDTNPKVTTFYPGFGYTQDVAGYRYVDIFLFDLSSEWESTATVTFSDESGAHKSFDLDFSVFTKDFNSRQ